MFIYNKVVKYLACVMVFIGAFSSVPTYTMMGNTQTSQTGGIPRELLTQILHSSITHITPLQDDFITIESLLHANKECNSVMRDAINALTAAKLMAKWAPLSNQKQVDLFHALIKNYLYSGVKWCLVQGGINTNASIDNAVDIGKTALMVAAELGDKAMVELLLQYGADKSAQCCTLRRVWISEGYEKIVKTAKDFALEGGHKDIAKLLS